MRSQAPGCLTPLGMIGMLIMVVGIGVSLWLQGGMMFSPGELSAASGPVLGGVQSHQQIGGNCAACHSSPWSAQSMTDRCLECHSATRAELQDPSTLHGSLVKNPDSVDCRACHSEHQGSQGNLTRVGSDHFDHQITGFALQAHALGADGLAFPCGDCHAQGLTRMDQKVCLACHGKLDVAFMTPHLQTFGANCVACHDGVDRYGASFDHNRMPFALTGKHLSVDCQGCHAGSSSLVMLQNTPAGCADCHLQDDAHAGQFGSQCAVCHTTQGWKPASFDHTRSNFPLTGAHQAVDCAGCHVDQVYKGTPADCAACHAQVDAHNGQYGNDCAACHSTLAWKPASFDHTRSNFPLTGAHQAVDCAGCHVDKVYKGTPADCAACHAQVDAHNGQYGNDCAACHSTLAWKPATFDHARSNFPLTGAHTGVACSQCHANGVFRGASTQCSACHADPPYHAGLLGSDCAACHTTSAWQPAAYNGPHIFPINHEDANACRDCHPASLATWTCYTCHDQGEITQEHQEENISDFSNCLECHANGGEPEEREGGGDD